MIAALVSGFACFVLVAFRPRTSLWIGIALPAGQAFFSPDLLRPMVLAILILGISLAWKETSSRQRNLILWLWAGTCLTILIGCLLAIDPSSAQSAVVNILYAATVASLAVVYRITETEWAICLIAWGVLVSIWLTSNDLATTGRTGSLYIGENANTLGMFAALGFVGAITIGSAKRRRLMHILVAVPIGAFLALGVVSSASRGALLVAAVGVVVVLFAGALRGPRIRALFTVAALAGGIAWMAMPALAWFLGRAGRDIEATTNLGSRQQILGTALETGLENPLSGVGFGGVHVTDIGVFGPVSAHNAYLGLFAAAGIVPVTLLGVLIFTAVGRARTVSGSNFLPVLAASLAVGLSLDWIGTAKLGPILLAIMTTAAGLPRTLRAGEADDDSQGAELGSKLMESDR